MRATLTKANVMNKPATQPKAVSKALTRDEMRAVLLGTRQKAKSQVISLFGIDVELRQPTLESILKARDTGDNASRAVDMIIEYAFVPGTDDHVFEDTDRPQMLKWPFGEDLTKLNATIADLTGVDVDAAMKEMEQDPLGG